MTHNKLIECPRCGHNFGLVTINEIWLLVGDCSNTHLENCPECNLDIVIKSYPETKGETDGKDK